VGGGGGSFAAVHGYSLDGALGQSDAALLRGRRGGIKAFLLDQKRIAGIGNVYVQDPQSKAGIHPLRRIDTLSDDEVEALWRAIRETLQESIDQGGEPLGAEPVRRTGPVGQQLPAGGLPGGTAVSQMRHNGGKDQDRQHEHAYLPELPAGLMVVKPGIGQSPPSVLGEWVVIQREHRLAY
jgi:hypothetical protein